MPVKWTPENDQMLLLLILQTQSVSVDASKVASAWPEGRTDRPTARAITERLVKIRSLATSNGAAPKRKRGEDVGFASRATQRVKTEDGSDAASNGSGNGDSRTPSLTPKKTVRRSDPAMNGPMPVHFPRMPAAAGKGNHSDGGVVDGVGNDGVFAAVTTPFRPKRSAVTKIKREVVYNDAYKTMHDGEFGESDGSEYADDD